MVSTVPDRATAVLSAQLASSILVVASVNAQSSAGAIQTILELGVPPHMLSNSLSAVTCQRLVRQICRICKVPAEPPSPQTLALQGISAEEAQRLQFFRGKGLPLEAGRKYISVASEVLGEAAA
jgi:type II secretory ATPase GspE/PulE/Tfp pilus assembly ATPase PilB-like protein